MDLRDTFSTDECIKTLSATESAELDNRGKQRSIHNKASSRNDDHEFINY
jgi:hypothetical protein